MDLREKYNDDQILGVLSKAVLEDVPDAQDKPASLLRSKVLELFGRVTSAVG